MLAPGIEPGPRVGAVFKTAASAIPPRQRPCSPEPQALVLGILIVAVVVRRANDAGANLATDTPNPALGLRVAVVYVLLPHVRRHEIGAVRLALAVRQVHALAAFELIAHRAVQHAVVVPVEL